MPVTVIEPGRLIGDLAVILQQPREMDLRAVVDCLFLRIGAEEYRAVIESDAKVATQLLETVAGHLVGLAKQVRLAGFPVAEPLEVAVFPVSGSGVSGADEPGSCDAPDR